MTPRQFDRLIGRLLDFLAGVGFVATLFALGLFFGGRS